MSVKPVVDLFEGHYYRPTLKGDPLNDAQKLAIWGFVDRHLFSKEIVTSSCEPPRKKTLYELHQPQSDMMHVYIALSKTYDSYDPESLAKIKASFASEECFDAFRRILKNPAENADEFLLDRESRPQIFAAQIFMKVVIQRASRSESIQEHCAQYREKMASNRGNWGVRSNISAKNQLLMRNDPIQRLPEGPIKTPLDVIFAHTFFQVPQVPQRTTSGSETVVEVSRLTREEMRGALRKLLTDLAQNPKLTHVIEALGTLILKEKGNLFFGDIDQLGKPYRADFWTTGFYNQHHCIMMLYCIHPFNGRPTGRLSTFIHEALHFIFNRVVRNDASPVVEGSEQEALLDEALKLDREHRKRLNPEELKGCQKCIWDTIVLQLENERAYFGKQGFDPNNPAHRQKMRVEAIVRIMEQTVNGATDKDFQAVAPNLFDFYYRYSKPLLEQYVTDNAHLFQRPTVIKPEEQLPVATVIESEETPAPIETEDSLEKEAELSIAERMCQTIARCFQWLGTLLTAIGRLICCNRASI